MLLGAGQAAAAPLAPALQHAAAAAACGAPPLLARAAQQQHHHQQRPPLACGPLQQQQARGFAAAKAKGKQQQQKGKGKKGAAAPKKKVKARIESKPMDEKDPLLQRVVAMLVPQPRSVPAESLEDAAAAAARAKEYSRLKMAEHKAWRARLHEQLQLKRAALAALPPALRAAAAEEDLEPFPLTRHALYETPPEGYRS